MDAEKAVVAATEAGARRGEQVGRLLNKMWMYSVFVWMYSLFLFFGIMILATAPWLAPPLCWCSCSPADVPSLVACYYLRHRPLVVSFAVVTLVKQTMLARVLERRPAPAPRLTPLAAWPLGVLTWMFVTMFCFSYLVFGMRTYYYSEWVAACVASAANLAMAARTVMRYLA